MKPPKRKPIIITVKGEIGEMNLPISAESDVWYYAEVFQVILLFLGFTPETVKSIFSDEVTGENLNEGDEENLDGEDEENLNEK